jgi:hypothetical protein
LIDRGFQVAVVADGTGSPGLGQEIGVERVRRAGGLISSVKAVYYEWVRTVEGDKRVFDQAGWADLPEGVSL